MPSDEASLIVIVRSAEAGWVCAAVGIGSTVPRPDALFLVGQITQRQAASLADGDSASMTVSAETGTENMGKS